MQLEEYSKKREITLEYQNYIETPPVQPPQMYQQACSNDTGTIDHWKATWIDQFKQNQKTFGPFKDRSLGHLFGQYELKPCIVAGAGPSLKYNGHYLKQRQKIPLISCLHNFHYMEDNDINPEFYVTLDAGPVTIEEVTEGGTKPESEYWERTKDRTLLAFCATHPSLLEKWKGKIYFFNCPVPNDEYQKETETVEKFRLHVGTGGNVLGACLYIAKAFFGANPIAFVGADFCFSYEKKFHAWDSKYDANLGRVLKAVDVFGNKVLTWQSYFNFKCWFDWVAVQIPGLYINCTDGGTFGAYQEGNLMAVKQMPLSHFINMYYLHEHMRDQSENPETEEKKLLF